ncbi:MAG: NAD(P)/FAD-dependent oxidoreductase [Desulfobacterales bacterium]|nr:NAD(P)/FAD-dependent oxidoreductase [Desulfobacterales bacterium]
MRKVNEMQNYDVVVVGSGSGGQTAAYTLCEYGLRVAVVENSPTPGGVCALAGCQAKKYFYEATETVARSHHLAGKGIAQPAQADWAAVLAQKNAFTDPIPTGTRTGLEGSGIDVIDGTAAFKDLDTMVVGNQIIKARFFILATGARPMPLPFPGADQLTTSTEFLARDHLPPRVVFVGGGFISFEFAHFAARLGPAERTTVLEVAPRPLGPFDSEMVDALVAASQAEGIDIHTGVTIQAVEKKGEGWVVRTDGADYAADLVVHGAGRVAALDDLRLQAGEVVFTRRGITVDAEMRTSNPRVFAVGDCAATLQLARVADYEGYVAAKNILAAVEGGAGARIDHRTVPTVLFTYPQYAMVGATEDALQAEGVRYYKNSDTQIGWPTYKRVGLAHAAFKVMVDEDSQILGAHVISDNASGLINTFKQAMIDGCPADKLFWNNVMSPYPSRESDIIYMLKPFFEDDLLEGL